MNYNGLHFTRSKAFLGIVTGLIVTLAMFNNATAQSGDVIMFRLEEEIVNQGNVGQIRTDYEENGKKWVAYFRGSIGEVGSLDLTLAIDLPDYFGITQEGQAGWITVWMDVGASIGLGLPIGFGAVKRPYDPSAPDSHTEFFDCSLPASIPCLSVDQMGITSSGDQRFFTATFTQQFELGASVTCQFHGLSLEVRRETLNKYLYQAMVPGVSISGLATLLITRIIDPSPEDIRPADWITQFRFATNMDSDEFFYIEDIRYDYLAMGEYAEINVDVNILESRLYKMEVRSGVLASPWPAWDWSPRVREEWLDPGSRTLTFQVRPDTPEETFSFWLYRRVGLTWQIVWKLEPYELHTVSTAPDRMKPKILATNAGSNPGTNVLVYFSEQMSDLCFVSGTVSLVGSNSGAHTATYEYDPDNQRLVIDPDVDFALGESVALVISQFVQDLAGNELGSQYEHGFSITAAPAADPTSIALSATLSPSTNVGAYSNVIVNGTAQYNTGSAVATGTVEIYTVEGYYTAPVSDGIFSHGIVAPSSSGNINIGIYGDPYGLSASISRYIVIQDSGPNSTYNFGRALSCVNISPDSPYDPLGETEYFYRDDSQVCIWVELLNVYEPVRIKWEYYRPDGSFCCDYAEYTTNPAEENPPLEYYDWYHTASSLTGFGYLPGRWTCRIYVNEGDGYEYQETVAFTVGYELVEHRMCKNVDLNFKPVNKTNSFTPSDYAAYAWWQFNNLVEDLDLKWEWIDPAGSIYSTHIEEPMSEYHLDEEPFNPPYSEYYSYCYMYINGFDASYRCGSWKVRVYVKNIGGYWELKYEDVYSITEKIPPAVACAHEPVGPTETQAVTINISSSDNNHLDVVTLYWNDGTNHQLVVQSGINSSTLGASRAIGPFASSQTVEYWTTAIDESGNTTQSVRNSFIVQGEIVSVPDPPIGEKYPDQYSANLYVAQGSTSSLSSPLEYRIYWGDGTYSDWGGNEHQKVWDAEGLFSIQAQARSQVNTSRVSEWSSQVPIIIDNTSPIVNITTNGGEDTAVVSDYLEIEGITNDGSNSSGLVITQINMGTSISEDPYFWCFNVPLEEGTNTIIVSSTDKGGNMGKDTICVSRVLPVHKIILAFAQATYAGADIKVKANIQEGCEPISSVTLYFREDSGPEQSQSAVYDGNHIWIATLGQFPGSAKIAWRLVAIDDQSNEALWPRDGGWMVFTVIEPGPIVAWGLNTDFGGNYIGQCDVPEPNEDFIAIAGGAFFALGLKSDGTIVRWGDDTWNPLPNEGYIAIAAGHGHGLGLNQDGTIVAWGDDGFGQCDVPEPNEDFVAIASGSMHSLGLKSDGTVVAWGENSYYQCDVPEPNKDFVSIATGTYHSLGLKYDGTIVAWGRNDNYGQCTVPEPNTDFIAVSAGSYHSLGLKSDGTIVVWGSNYWNQWDVPAPNEDYIAVSGGSHHTLGLRSNGKIEAWGWNSWHQCDTPEPIANSVAIAGAPYHSLAILESSMPLAAPILENPANGTICQSTSGTLDWSDVITAAGYMVQIGTECGSGTEHAINNNSSYYDYEGLNPGTLYTWRVKTKNSYGIYGDYSECDSFTTSPPQLPSPSIVSPSNGASCQPHSGRLDWTDVTGAVGYFVEFGVCPYYDCEMNFVDTSYYDYNDNFCSGGGTCRYWQVWSIDSCMHIDPSSGGYLDGHFYVSSGSLAAPTLESPANGSTDEATFGRLEWSDVLGNSGYRVRIGTSCGSGNEYEVINSYRDYTDLAPGTTYFWSVATKNSCNEYGDYSACDSFAVAGWVDVTNEATGGSMHGFGMAWGDYNNDEYLDLYISNSGANKLCQNNSGEFIDASIDVLEDMGNGRAAVWGDYDNDGNLDLFLANIGCNKLFHNEGGGVFTDASPAYFTKADNTFGAAWVDYNRDGLLDLYYANAGSDTCRLLTNQNGALVKGHVGSCIEHVGECVGVAWGDYDNDGYQDLYLSTWSEPVPTPNKLFHNDGNGDFTDVMNGPLAYAGKGQGVAWADYDNDGDLDLSLATYGGGCKLYRNDGNGAFVDVTTGPLAEMRNVRTLAWGDYDNDGDLDVYLAVHGENVLLRNEGAGEFSDVTYGLLGDAGNTRGTAWIDYDNDGRLDLFMVNDASQNKMLQNTIVNGNHWIEMELRGCEANRFAIGARVRIVAGGVQQIREVSASSGYLSQAPLRIHFGLGSVGVVDTLQVIWPSIPARIYEARSLTSDGIMAIDEVPASAENMAIADISRLYQAYPNPFNPTTIIYFDVSPGAGNVELRIFDVQGRLVRTLVNAPLSAGKHSCVWDACDSAGRKVTSGLYLYQLQMSGYRATKKMVLLR